MANGKIRFGKQSGGQLALVIPDGVANTEVIFPESGTLVSVGTTVKDNAIARYDGTTGEVQDSSILIDDNGNVSRTVATGNANILLNVGTTGASNYIRFQNTADNDASFVYNIGSELRITQATATANSMLVFSTQDIERMRIDSAGNLLLTSGTGGLGYGTGSGGVVTQLTSKTTAVTLNKPSGNITLHNSALASGATATFILKNSLITTLHRLKILGLGGIATHSAYNVWNTFGSNGTCAIYLKNISESTLTESLSIAFNLEIGATS